MPEESFLDQCRHYRDAGFLFLGLQTNQESVTYILESSGEVVQLEQAVEDGGVRSVAQVFPLADFAERQMFRDCQVKAIGNINLIPPENDAD